MGQYNPDAPTIVGHQWRGLTYSGDALSDSSEQAVGWSQAAGTTVRAGRVSLDGAPTADGEAYPTVAVYPRGMESATSHVSSIMLPVASGTLVGATLVGAATVQAALLTPDDGAYVDMNGPMDVVGMRFAIPLIDPPLTGKRIVGMDLHYRVTGPVGQFLSLSMARPLPSQVWLYGTQVLSTDGNINVIRLGDINHFWDPIVDPNTTSDRFPWTYARLISLSPAGNLSTVLDFSGSPVAHLLLQYVALRVSWCTERRTMVGSSLIRPTAPGAPWSTGPGTSVRVPMRSLPALTADPALPAGDWTVSAALGHGGPSTGSGGGARTRGLTSPEPLRTHPGMILTRPSVPATRIPGPADTTVITAGPAGLTTSSTRLPLLRLGQGASEIALTGMPGYGIPAAAPVRQGAPVRQSIYQTGSVPPTGSPYPQVRYVARRYPDTTGDLTLSRVSDPTRTVAMTVALHDTMDVLRDGSSVTPFGAQVMSPWRDCKLQFDSNAIPSIDNSGTLDEWEFSTPDINGWDILAARSTSILLPGTSQTDTMTYGRGIVPTMSSEGITLLGADIPITFASLVPALTDLEVTFASQPLTGFGSGCIPECCIATSIGYHEITWAPAPTGIIGYSYTEIERSDEQTDWQVIARVTDSTVTVTPDYEARVGVSSTYRARVCALEGCSDWSPTATRTLTGEEAIGGVCTDTGFLIFTSNFAPERTLAYSMAWESSPREEWTFVEADTQIFQRIYGRDYQVAFRGTERGGVQFSRTLLVNAISTPAQTADSGYDQLRDLAWAPIPYVAVRDELGNRWLANLLVPSAVTRRGQRQNSQTHLQFANVTVTEVTDTPFPVDPPPPPTIVPDVMCTDITNPVTVPASTLVITYLAPEHTCGFVAPESGNVLVHVSAHLRYLAVPAVGDRTMVLYVEVRSGSMTGPLVKSAESAVSMQANSLLGNAGVMYVSQLVPGSTYVVRLGYLNQQTAAAVEVTRRQIIVKMC